MDRMEILRLAFNNSKNANEAMSLAQKMADFVSGKNDPLEDGPKPINKKMLILQTDKGPARARTKWTPEEARRLKHLVLSKSSMDHMAFTLKRTKSAIRKAIEREMWNWNHLRFENDGQPDEAQEWADFDKDC